MISVLIHKIWNVPFRKAVCLWIVQWSCDVIAISFNLSVFTMRIIIRKNGFIEVIQKSASINSYVSWMDSRSSSLNFIRFHFIFISVRPTGLVCSLRIGEYSIVNASIGCQRIFSSIFFIFIIIIKENIMRYKENERPIRDASN